MNIKRTNSKQPLNRFHTGLQSDRRFAGMEFGCAGDRDNADTFAAELGQLQTNSALVHDGEHERV